jgi:hypothetical protein
MDGCHQTQVLGDISRKFTRRSNVITSAPALELQGWPSEVPVAFAPIVAVAL